MSDRLPARPGPLLLATAVSLFLVTRVIVWLPLGFIGTFINGFLWPVILLAGGIGGFLTWRQLRRGDRQESPRRS
ncbi:MAG: hypothetical protein AAF567_18780 [Actinomycetota bacterium]